MNTYRNFNADDVINVTSLLLRTQSIC